jgi:hypothetical protein
MAYKRIESIREAETYKTASLTIQPWEQSLHCEGDASPSPELITE